MVEAMKQQSGPINSKSSGAISVAVFDVDFDSGIEFRERLAEFACPFVEPAKGPSRNQRRHFRRIQLICLAGKLPVRFRSPGGPASPISCRRVTVVPLQLKRAMPMLVTSLDTL